MAAASRTLIWNGTLIDGTGAPPRPATSVLIEGNRIAAVGQGLRPQDLNGSQPLTVVDATGLTVMPGLIDAHCHLTYGEVRTEEELDLYTSLEYRAIRAVWNAQKVLRAGVTAISDPGGSGYVGVAVRDAILAGMFPGPRMTTAGRFLSTSNSIADYYPEWVGVPDSSSGVLVNTKDAMVDEVRRQIKSGVDLIKIGDSMFGQYQAFADDEVALITETAHRLKRRVTIHARGPGEVAAAVKAGVDWIMHGELMTDEVLDLLVQSGIPLCPTLTLVANTAQWGERVGASPRRCYFYAKHLEKAAETLTKARKAGVPFMAGTDSGFAITPYGHWHARELELLVDYVGFTPLEAISIGTRNNARALNLAGELGTIEVGKLADLLVLDGDPVRNIRVLQDRSRLRAVYKDGQPVDLSGPWPERTVWPHERALIAAREELYWEDVYPSAEVREAITSRLQTDLALEPTEVRE
ncbi:MAG TPA: amidohydrolase family protein [Chloroflexota bacterium]|jgi:imidazolonepropionase-like amidohydrolase|nr:amidohydrolase family protein [Chloroflexota bacterium]